MMGKISVFIFCTLFFFISFLGMALGGDTVNLNHVKCIKAKDFPGHYLEARLIADKRTRVQIMVIKKDEILEHHRLVVGSDGVVEGRFRGAKSWGYTLPSGTDRTDLCVDISVQPLAGSGDSIRYEIRSLSAEDKSGFLFASLATH